MLSLFDRVCRKAEGWAAVPGEKFREMEVNPASSLRSSWEGYSSTNTVMLKLFHMQLVLKLRRKKDGRRRSRLSA